MAVGSLRAMVIDVDDLDVAERFWGAVSGLPLVVRAWEGRYSRLGTAGGCSLLLQLVPDRKPAIKNRAHPDFTVDDVDRAVAEVVALGGGVVRGKIPYPSTGEPRLEAAIAADPFGNEFCLIRELPR